MKLWFFRTPGGKYGLAAHKVDPGEMTDVDAGFDEGFDAKLAVDDGDAEGFPPLKPGECIPVELVPVKKKKVRKG